ncbi:MAG: ATP-binding cassette domain-containing protein, partial [Phycisphaeraceae bacterium]|nr:ATP-binding cassette domain-containing protein [Phycisphaeraceae bacterium]
MNDTPTTIFSMRGVSRRHGQQEVIKDISLSFFYGAKIGVVGPNGAGKSTVLRIIAGQDDDYEGEVEFSPGYRVGLLEQEPTFDEEKTVGEVVEEGAAETLKLLKRFEEISDAFAEPMDDDAMQALLDEQGEVQEQIDSRDGWNLQSQLDMAMQALDCPPADTPVNVLSGGERRRVALCRILLDAPDVLLLDEPTNHLDTAAVAWLQRHLADYEGTVILVTHDRYFLDQVTGWVLELDEGRGVPWRGNYTQ